MTLEQSEIAVYVTDPKTLAEVETGILELGELLGSTESAERAYGDIVVREVTVLKILDRWTDDPDHVPSVPSVALFVQISKEPLFTIGKGSYLNNLIWEAGGRSVTAKVESAFPKLSKETASTLNPEVIILSDSPDNQEANEAFRNSPAVKNGRVYKINADILSRPGPRLVDALEQIARHLHPEKFE
jgi:iron complex transport system substrate-binding protein